MLLAAVSQVAVPHGTAPSEALTLTPLVLSIVSTLVATLSLGVAIWARVHTRRYDEVKTLLAVAEWVNSREDLEARTLVHGIHDIADASAEQQQAARRVCRCFNFVGYLVKCGAVPLSSVEDLWGPLILQMYRKLASQIERDRAELHETYWAYFSFLVAHLRDSTPMKSQGHTPSKIVTA